MAGEVWPVEPLKRARSLPARAYTDPAMFEVEKAKVFKRAWLPVGRQEDWPEVGSYRAVDLFGEPLLVMRDPQGAIVTFANVCRQRSMPTLDGAGPSLIHSLTWRRIDRVRTAVLRGHVDAMPPLHPVAIAALLALERGVHGSGPCWPVVKMRRPQVGRVRWSPRRRHQDGWRRCHFGR